MVPKFTFWDLLFLGSIFWKKFSVKVVNRKIPPPPKWRKYRKFHKISAAIFPLLLSYFFSNFEQRNLWQEGENDKKNPTKNVVMYTASPEDDRRYGEKLKS